jgi:hypothetical protein
MTIAYDRFTKTGAKLNKHIDKISFKACVLCMKIIPALMY